MQLARELVQAMLRSLEEICHVRVPLPLPLTNDPYPVQRFNEEQDRKLLAG
jgi:hypothetical protein